ncbi:uncharacterized protein [Lolium perenne]|uniref:uncharacterized protein n=1 Tax=Lolium perenne TaxID=4522 RepID=UPI0021F616DD|nr:uncharacterized protein LOC127336349 [Lolium perenne]
MQYHVKNKAATSAMPSRGKDTAATSTMRPKHAFADENLSQALLASSEHGIQRMSLNRNSSLTPQLRAKEMANTGLSCGVSQKHIGKERSPSLGTGLCGEVSQKQREKVDTGLIPKKHNSKEKMCPPGPVNMTAARVAGEKKQHTRSNNAKGKMCRPDQLHQHTRGIQGPVSMPEARVAAEKQQHKRSNNAKEKMCHPDQLRQHTQGIQGPVSMTEACVAGEKKQQTRSNTSFPTKRTTPQLKSRASSRCSNASTSRPVDPHDRGNTAAAQEQRQSAVNKTAKDMEAIIQKLNELGLGDDISFEENYGYLMQLPYTHIHTTINSGINSHYMEIRHAVYRIRSFKLSQNVSKYELCRDELLDCPMDLLEKEEFPSDFLVDMDYFKFFQQEGVLDWYFHPKLCKIAGLDDYQRLVPRNHWKHDAYEYANWSGYMEHFHTYETEHEYIEYFETLLSELKWLENCLPIRRTASAIADRICTRGIYQATKIATRFSKMTSHLAFFGFYECFTYMSIEATWCDGSDDLFFEIWKRVAQEKESLRDAVKEVYKLNKFFSRQDFMKYTVEEDDLIILEKGFQTCMRGVTKDVSEDEARELIAEAVKKKRIKPKFYHEYIKKKMDIARSIGLIPMED